jgi:formylglycine-generating enzyme required for sulfatase activity
MKLTRIQAASAAAGNLPRAGLKKSKMGFTMNAHTQYGIRRYRRLTTIACSMMVIMALSGCGEADYATDGYHTDETGKITFNVLWEGAPTTDSSRFRTRALDCVNAGISTVSFEVFDSRNNLLAFETFACAKGHGTVGNVPVGTNRKLAVTGTNGNRTVLYYGEVTGLGIDKGHDTHVGEVVCRPSDFVNSFGMAFNLIPAGNFTMGSPSDETGHSADEIQHDVTLTQAFYMQTTEATQWQWEAVMGSNPSYFVSCGGDCPVEQVTWNDIQAFLSALNRLGQGTYRLPTEAEWEYAARSGSTTGLDNENNLGLIDCSYDYNLNLLGWYCYNSGVSYTGCWDNSTNGGSTCSGPNPVAQKSANPWHLYDMHGNVWEWVQDWYDTYDSVPAIDPTGPENGSNRVGRSGSWYNDAGTCRSASRGGNTPNHLDINLGARLVLVVPKLPDTCQSISHTATFGEDSDYSINPPSYTDHADGTVTDNVTGLMWQKEDDDTARTWDDAISYCNALTLASYTDWRSPTVYELMGIVSSDTYDPPIDTTNFPGTDASGYWSSLETESDVSLAWNIIFNNGAVLFSTKSSDGYVRCVRGQKHSFGKFMVNNDGTVTDNMTGLIWQRDHGGQKTWEGAISYCEEQLLLGGYEDWRLPSRNELNSIIDYDTYDPAIDATAFPGTRAAFYWSSTTFANDPLNAWSAHFYTGLVNYWDKSSSDPFVRCVRGGGGPVRE